MRCLFVIGRKLVGGSKISNIQKLNSLGDHIRSRRLDLRLFQKDVASQIGVSTDTIILWESNAATPQLRHIPKIVKFLGYNPLPLPESLADALAGVVGR